MKLSETHYLVAAVVPGGATYRLETAQFSKDEEAEAKQELQYHLAKNRPARIFVAVEEPRIKPIHINTGNYPHRHHGAGGVELVHYLDGRKKWQS